MKCSGCGQRHGKNKDMDRGMAPELAAKVPRVPPERRGQLWYATFAAEFQVNLSLLLREPWNDLKVIELACGCASRADIAAWALETADELARDSGWRTPTDAARSVKP